MPEVEKTLSEAEIRLQMQRILASPSFRSSKRCARFLEFIVTQTLDGRASTLKERTLATEVFDRPQSWETGDDTIVRVGAREVRKRLAQFYSSPDALLEPLRIYLPLGSYVPEFTRAEAAAPLIARAPEPAPPAVFAAPPITFVPQPRRRTLSLLWLLLVLVPSVAIFTWVSFRSPAPSGLALFWDPYFRTTEPVIVAVAHPLLYEPSSHAYQEDTRLRGNVSLLARPLLIAPKDLTGSDFIPRPDEFLAFGDSVAATSLQILLAVHHKETHLRFASKVEFADLRESPAVLVGAFSNRWTIEMVGQYRYHFGYNDHWQPAILDGQKPGANWTSRTANGQASELEDYFLICRLPNSPSGNIIIAAAGISHLGTEAAGRLLVDEHPLAEIERKLPDGWMQRNVELVMHTRVIGNSPGDPELVASYSW